MTLPFKRMSSLCQDDKLHINNEAQLLSLIDRYLEVREKNKALSLLDEETDQNIGNNKNWEELVKSGVLT